MAIARKNPDHTRFQRGLNGTVYGRERQLQARFAQELHPFCATVIAASAASVTGRLAYGACSECCEKAHRILSSDEERGRRHDASREG
jgi:hypothetical protein